MGEYGGKKIKENRVKILMRNKGLISAEVVKTVSRDGFSFFIFIFDFVTLGSRL